MLSDVTFKDERHLLRIHRQDRLSPWPAAWTESNPRGRPASPNGLAHSTRWSSPSRGGRPRSSRSGSSRKESWAVDELGEVSAPSPKRWPAYLQAAVATRLNVIVSGGTGFGQDHYDFNALSSSSTNSERILTIEDTAELQLQQTPVGRMKAARPNVRGPRGGDPARTVSSNALRMRPDRIIVGKPAASEVIDMLPGH